MKLRKATSRQWILGVLMAGMSLFVEAEPASLRVIEGAPAVYTVKKGDTLWAIAAYYLASPWRWPELWQANRSEVADPHWIYPGDQLYLHWVDGQPRLMRKPHKHLSPTVKITPKPVTTLPADLMLPYIAQDKLLAEKDLSYLPHVIGDSRAQGYIPRGETIWVDMPLTVGDRWGIYRPDLVLERELASGESRQVSGLKEIARGEVVKATENASAVMLTDARYEVQPNDVMLPAPLPVSMADMSFSPSPSPVSLDTHVVAGLGGMAYIATHEVVVLDQGHLDGVAEGHVFTIIRPGAKYSGNKGGYAYSKPDSPIRVSPFVATSSNESLQEIPIGEVMVIRPYEYFSLAVVTKAIEPFRAGARLVSPLKG